jgi:hypothetical protein
VPALTLFFVLSTKRRGELAYPFLMPSSLVCARKTVLLETAFNYILIVSKPVGT